MSKRAADGDPVPMAKRIPATFGQAVEATYTVDARPEKKRSAHGETPAAKTARHAMIEYMYTVGADDAAASAHSQANASPTRNDAAEISSLPRDVALLIMARLSLTDLLTLLRAWRVGRLHAFAGAEQLFKMREHPERFGINILRCHMPAEARKLGQALLRYISANRAPRAMGTPDYCTTAELYTKMLAACMDDWTPGETYVKLQPGGPDLAMRIDDVLSDAYDHRMRQLVTIDARPKHHMRGPLRDAFISVVSMMRGLDLVARQLLLTINNGVGIDAPAELDPVRVKNARLAMHATALLHYMTHWKVYSPLELQMPSHILMTVTELARGAWTTVAPAALAQHVYGAWEVIDPPVTTGVGAGETLNMLAHIKQSTLVPATVYTARAAASFYRQMVTMLRNAQTSGATHTSQDDDGNVHRLCRLHPGYGREDGAWSWLLQGMAMPMDNFNKSKQLDNTMMVLMRDADRAVRAAGVYPSQLVDPDAAFWVPANNDDDRPPNAVYEERAWERMLDTARYVIDWVVWRTRERQWCIRSLLCALVGDEQPAAALAVCYAVQRPLQQIVMDLCPTLQQALRAVMSIQHNVPEDAALFNTVVPIIAKMHHAANDKRMLMTWAVLVQFELWVLSTVPGCHYIDTHVEHWNMGQQQVARALVDVMRRLRQTPLNRAHVRLSADARQLHFAPADS